MNVWIFWKMNLEQTKPHFKGFRIYVLFLKLLFLKKISNWFRQASFFFAGANLHYHHLKMTRPVRIFWRYKFGCFMDAWWWWAAKMYFQLSETKLETFSSQHFCSEGDLNGIFCVSFTWNANKRRHNGFQVMSPNAMSFRYSYAQE